MSSVYDDFDITDPEIELEMMEEEEPDPYSDSGSVFFCEECQSTVPTDDDDRCRSCGTKVEDIDQAGYTI